MCAPGLPRNKCTKCKQSYSIIIDIVLRYVNDLCVVLGYLRVLTSYFYVICTTLNKRRDAIFTICKIVFPPRLRSVTERAAERSLPSAVLRPSAKRRRFETHKWELPKKFPFSHILDVKRGIPSPLHDHPMRVFMLLRWFVYDLTGTSEEVPVCILSDREGRRPIPLFTAHHACQHDVAGVFPRPWSI